MWGTQSCRSGGGGGGGGRRQIFCSILAKALISILL